MAITRRNQNINALTSNLGNASIGARLLPVLARVANQAVRAALNNNRGGAAVSSANGGPSYSQQTVVAGTRRRGARQRKRQPDSIPRTVGGVQRTPITARGICSITKTATTGTGFLKLLFWAAGDCLDGGKFGETATRVMTYDYVQFLAIDVIFRPTVGMNVGGKLVLAYDATNRTKTGPVYQSSFLNCTQRKIFTYHNDGAMNIKPFNTNNGITLTAKTDQIDMDQADVGRLAWYFDVSDGTAGEVGYLDLTIRVLCW